MSEIELPMSKIQDPTIAMPTEIDLDYSFWDDLALPSIPME